MDTLCVSETLYMMYPTGVIYSISPIAFFSSLIKLSLFIINVFIYRLKSDIKEDTFLIPYTVAEMAMCHYQLGDKERAIQMLQDTR